MALPLLCKEVFCQLPYKNHEASTNAMHAKEELLPKLICLHLKSMPPLAVLCTCYVKLPVRQGLE